MPKNGYKASIKSDEAAKKPVSFLEMFSDVALRSMIQSEANKIYRDNDLTVRDRFAKEILNGICSGDWRFDIPDGKTWDEVAAKRAYEIADAMIKEREISNV